MAVGGGVGVAVGVGVGVRVRVRVGVAAGTAVGSGVGVAVGTLGGDGVRNGAGALVGDGVCVTAPRMAWGVGSADGHAQPTAHPAAASISIATMRLRTAEVLISEHVRDSMIHTIRQGDEPCQYLGVRGSSVGDYPRCTATRRRRGAEDGRVCWAYGRARARVCPPRSGYSLPASHWMPRTTTVRNSGVLYAMRLWPPV
jgi:hypothetical protein